VPPCGHCICPPLPVWLQDLPSGSALPCRICRSCWAWA